MQPVLRRYNHALDYWRVDHFLTRTYGRNTGGHVNWLQPRWEYMHYHPLIEGIERTTIGLWEEHDDIVAAVHPEHRRGTAYFEVDPGQGSLKKEMLSYAESHLYTGDEKGKSLRIYINDSDEMLQDIAEKKGYRTDGASEPMSHFIIHGSLPPVSLPQGFRLKSLADDNDLTKVHRVLWRGFDHGDEPPEEGIEERRFMQLAPNFKKDLTVVIEAPCGSFASYCGMWYEPVNRFAYVEPVATDPDFRQKGLARAAVLEGIRRCERLGATVAYVGSTLPLYTSLGFRQIFNRSAWGRFWT
jgi:GNAT superfamily N-acetyltransferase